MSVTLPSPRYLPAWRASPARNLSHSGWVMSRQLPGTVLRGHVSHTPRAVNRCTHQVGVLSIVFQSMPNFFARSSLANFLTECN